MLMIYQKVQVLHEIKKMELFVQTFCLFQYRWPSLGRFYHNICREDDQSNHLRFNKLYFLEFSFI